MPSQEDLYFRSKIRTVRSRCSSKGLEFDLNMKWMRSERRAFCPILGTKLHYLPGNTSKPANTPSIDRINPELGYIQSNCRIISYRANTLLNDSNVWELRQLLDSLQEDCEKGNNVIKDSKLCSKPKYLTKKIPESNPLFIQPTLF